MIESNICLPGGLNDEFDTVHSKILNVWSLPNVEEVYSLIEIEEQQKHIMNKKDENSNMMGELMRCLDYLHGNAPIP